MNDGQTLAYAIFCLLASWLCAYALYKAATGDKFWLFIVCLQLGFAYGDYLYKKDNIISGFLKGLFG